MVLLYLETITGHQYELQVDLNEPLSVLKSLIYARVGVPASHQGLILGDKCLPNDDSVKLCHCGLGEGTRLKLAVIARSGPVNHKKAPTAEVESYDDEPGVSVRLSDRSEDNESLSIDLTFDTDAQESVIRRAEENQRTKIKMMELKQLRRGIDRMRMEKKPSVELPSYQPHRRPSPTTVQDNRNWFGLSAPEDTSAKESSAGETEWEEPLYLRHYFPSRVPLEPERVSFVRRPCAPSRPNRVATRPSSSSDPESSGIVNSEVEEALYTADEEIQIETKGYESAEHEQYFTGSPEPVTPRLRPVSDTEPSELSSGMILAEAMMHKKCIRKKQHKDPKLPPKRSVRPPSVVAKSRPRSKSRQNVLNVGAKQPTSTTGDSSSDDQRRTQNANLVASNTRKQAANVARGAKYRTFAAPDYQVRRHRPPQSSQGQQRCNTCGYSLAMAASFHCRCGKTLCKSHRLPESHTCSYDLGAREPKMRQARMQDVSD